MNNLFAFLRLYKWRIISVCIGILFTVLIFTIGFWRTLLISAIVSAAYFIGTIMDQSGRTGVAEFFRRLFGRNSDG